MDADDDCQSDYFTVMSFQQNPQINNENISYQFSQSSKNHQPKVYYQEYENTLSTSKMSIIQKNNQPDSDSCIGQFQDIVHRLPDLQENKKVNMKVAQKKQTEISSEQLMGKSKWVNQTDLKCTIEYQGKIIQTLCRLNGSQLIFVDGGCRFKLSNIRKIKVLYQHYQKRIWFTYGQQSKSLGKFKIFIENDTNDDIYLLYARVIVQKLQLLGYETDFKEKQSQVIDRFIMSGQIIKKSQFFGRWDKRKMVITDRIQSFKDQTCTFQISNIKQLWTRFDIHNQNLIIKVRHGMLKTQLGLPIMNYTLRFGEQNWLYRIYRLVTALSI